MTSKGSLTLAAALLAACGSHQPSKTVVVTSRPSDRTLVCTGTVNSEGYPMGKAPSRPATVVVVLNKDPSLTKAVLGYRDIRFTVDGKTVDTLADPKPVCQPKKNPSDNCSALQNGDTLKIANSTAMVFTSLDINTKSGEIKFSGGGLDGGWAFVGTCRAP